MTTAIMDPAYRMNSSLYSPKPPTPQIEKAIIAMFATPVRQARRGLLWSTVAQLC
jgi:hypothetical protein